MRPLGEPPDTGGSRTSRHRRDARRRITALVEAFLAAARAGDFDDPARLPAWA